MKQQSAGKILLIIIGLSLACSFLQPSRAGVSFEKSATIKAVTTNTPESNKDIAALPAGNQQTYGGAEDINYGALALEYLHDLAQYGARLPGTQNHETAQRYILMALREMDYNPVLQPFRTKSGQSTANITVIKPGLSPRVIIVGAHYDSVKTGFGVDDNASGVSVLLETAKNLKNVDTPFTIHFVFFDAEETGLEGSKFHASKMSNLDIENTAAMINLDSLAVGDYTYIYGNEGTKGAIRDWALDYAQKKGLSLITQPGKNPDYPAGTTVDASDHVPFLRLGLQYAYFEATNWDLGNLDGYTQVDESLGEHGEIWHTPYDDINYIQATFPGRLDAHFSLFTNVLMHILTEYWEPV